MVCLHNCELTKHSGTCRLSGVDREVPYDGGIDLRCASSPLMNFDEIMVCLLNTSRLFLIVYYKFHAGQIQVQQSPFSNKTRRSTESVSSDFGKKEK